MKHRDDKIARAAHIKARTEGTSNEISFSVLDAAKYAVDNKRQRFSFHEFVSNRAARRETSSDVSRETSEGSPSKASRIRRAQEGSRKQMREAKVARVSRKPSRHSAQHAAAKQKQLSTKRISLEEEIARRKARRRLGRIAALSTVAVITMVFVAIGVWIWHVDVTEQQGYEAMLMDSIELVSQADDVILQIDGIVNDPFSDDSKKSKQSTLSEIPGCLDVLEQADVKAREASDGLKDPTVKDIANQTVISIAARQAMMQQASELLDASLQVDEAEQQCQDIWSVVLDADDVTHEASKLVEADDPAGSKEKTQQANRLFADSLAQLKTFQAEHAGVDLSVATAYIEKRIEAAGYAIAADDALIDRNKEEALVQNDWYNEAETEAATLATKLPSNMDKLFHDAYSEQYSSLIKAYTAKRAEAGTSDAVIRDYLGAQGK